MVRASPIKTSFNSGEWSPIMGGHINLERFPDSSQLMLNMLALKQGATTRRGGSYFVREVKDSSNNTVLIPFEYSISDAYQIEIGDQYCRFYKNNSVITESSKNITNITQANPAVVTSASHGYSNGDEVFINTVVGMTEVNGKFYRVANASTNTYELTDIDGNNINSTGYTAYSSGGTGSRVYEISSPYNASDLLDADGLMKFQFTQSADVIYIAHPDYKVRTLSRTSDTAWAITTTEMIDGAYLDLNSTTTTLALSGTSGSVTVTASAAVGINGGSGFVSTDVGRLIRWKDPAGNWTWLEITAYSSATSVTADIKGAGASAGTATTNWRLGVFSETTGYPRSITFFQNRLVLAGCETHPDRYHMSKTGGYSISEILSSPSDADGTVTDDAAIDGNLGSGKVSTIQWCATDNRGLLIGTASNEWILRASTNGEVLTPSNTKADKTGDEGSAYIQPSQMQSGVLFGQFARRKILDIIYSFDRDQLLPRDLTIPAEHITRSGVCQFAVQKEPINCMWMRLTNGKLIGLTYYPLENVFAFHQHQLGGGGLVKSISVIPSADSSRDELWMIVERTINGSTRKYVEYLTRYYEDDINLEDAICVDSALTYDGAATAIVTGLEHLEGETVKVMLDGKSHPDLTVSGGSVTLANDRTGSTIQIGLSAPWAIKTQRVEAGSTDGTSQGKNKRVISFVVRLLNSLGLYYGKDALNYEEYDFDQGSEYDETVVLFSGDTESITWPDGTNKDGVLYLQHDGVFPMTILSIMPQIVTRDKG